MSNSSTLPLPTLVPSQLELAAQQLIQESIADPWGDISPALYDTARVLLLPRSQQPEGSLDYLLREQHDNGSWGEPDAYCLVPTLAATASLLHLTLTAVRGEEVAGDASVVSHAAWRGLVFLAPTLRSLTQLPDTVAIELMMPLLVEEIEETQGALRRQLATNPAPTLHPTSCFWSNIRECLKIKLPSPDRRRLSRLRVAARLGQSLPTQLVHYLEVLGRDLEGIKDLCPRDGVYGGSPAATIAMAIHSSQPSSQTRSRLLKMAARFGGALPTMTQLDTFERSWTIYNLLRANVPIPKDWARAAADYFVAGLGARGTSFAPGQLPDADNSAVVLYVLSALGYRVDLNCLLTYESEIYFRCYDGERHPSVSTNAHILEAFGQCRGEGCWSGPQSQNAIAKTSAYLLSAQQYDGSWSDNWHASPYYATACSVLALASFGVGNTRDALDRAIAWVLRTQREDGSWGIWCGTLEETAYALQILLLAGNARDAVAIKPVARRGQCFLSEHFHASPSDRVHMRLWHGKELYEPKRIVRAAVLSALYLCAKRLNTQPSSQKSLTLRAA